MPCYDKKLEASRNDFYNDILNTRDVDCVIATLELDALLAENNLNLADISPSPLDALAQPGAADDRIVGHAGSGSVRRREKAKWNFLVPEPYGVC